jgi:DNA-directed RNA polymerase subunit omega
MLKKLGWSGWWDLNPRPPAPEAGALPSYATARETPTRSCSADSSRVTRSKAKLATNASAIVIADAKNSFDNLPRAAHFLDSFGLITMLGSRLSSVSLAPISPTIVPFPAGPARAAHSLRIMTTQLLQEAAQVIPNPQLLINVISKRVRQLGLGHRPMVEVGLKASLTDIALKEIIAGKLTYEEKSDAENGA